MSESDNEQDESEKTEEPTARRLEQAREKGQVVQSKEIMHWMMIACGGLITFAIFPVTLPGLMKSLMPFIERAHDFQTSPSNLKDILELVMMHALQVLWLPFILLVVAALMAGLSQTKLVVSGEVLRPKLERISLSKGLKRLLSAKALVEFAKSILKLAILVGAVIYAMKSAFRELQGWVSLNIEDIFPIMTDILYAIFATVLSVVTVIAALDYLYQRHQFMKSMRMSRHDIKEELKQSEGDPVIKSRLRQIRHERAKKRMMQEVPHATVILTNPTHYSVALKYEIEKMNAPVVVAKGLDLIALKIREVAKEHDVPVIENPPLARALYDTVDLDEEIPHEHYNAVAEVIRIVMEIKKRRFT